MTESLEKGKPRLLDLFCGAGGAAMGYSRAGFEVVGVDHKPQPNYPFTFLQADALELLGALAKDGALFCGPGMTVLTFDAIHASPPCQHASSITAVSGNRAEHPNLIPATRQLLIGSGLPYVIENVERAQLVNPVRLCAATYCPTIVEDGERFYLKRHRLFECSFPIMVEPCTCSRHKGSVLGIYGGGTRQDTRAEANPSGGNTRKANLRQGHLLMGTTWMTRSEMTQAIPPAYTEHIGSYLARHLQTEPTPA